MRRWAGVGAAAGFVAGVAIWANAAEGDGSLLGSLAFFIPMGAALVVMLWMSTYRWDFTKVWGWRLLGLTSLALVTLMATAIGVGCLQGICGDP